MSGAGCQDIADCRLPIAPNRQLTFENRPFPSPTDRYPNSGPRVPYPDSRPLEVSMSLVKSPRMTEDKAATTRRNQRHFYTAFGRLGGSPTCSLNSNAINLRWQLFERIGVKTMLRKAANKSFPQNMLMITKVV